MGTYRISLVVRKNRLPFFLSLSGLVHHVSANVSRRFWWYTCIDEFRILVITKVTLNSIGPWSRCFILWSFFVAWETVWNVFSNSITLKVAQEILSRSIIITRIVISRTWYTSFMFIFRFIKSLFARTPSSCFWIFNCRKLIYTIFVHLDSLTIRSWPRGVSLLIDAQRFLKILCSSLNIILFTLCANSVKRISILARSWDIRIVAFSSLGEVHFLVCFSTNTEGVNTRFCVDSWWSGLSNLKFRF